MRLVIQPDYEQVSSWAAAYTALQIKKFDPGPGKPFVLGLPTGSSPVGMYRELIRLHREGSLSFANVVTFNMDEYVGLPENHPQSFHTFMWDTFFSKIDISPGNVFIPDGNASDTETECARYEEKIKSYGGVELFIGGVGSDGHIAFNEPGSSLASRTRIKTLTRATLAANSRFFDHDISKVPKTALTIGVGTFMEARKVILIATGSDKALALHKGVEEGINHMWIISALQFHPHAVIVCDEDATGELKVDTVRYFKDIETPEQNPRNILAGIIKKKV
jgi:glucosamine-6-phosphate deaminase